MKICFSAKLTPLFLRNNNCLVNKTFLLCLLLLNFHIRLKHLDQWKIMFANEFETKLFWTEEYIISSCKVFFTYPTQLIQVLTCQSVGPFLLVLFCIFVSVTPPKLLHRISVNLVCCQDTMFRCAYYQGIPILLFSGNFNPLELFLAIY